MQRRVPMLIRFSPHPTSNARCPTAHLASEQLGSVCGRSLFGVRCSMFSCQGVPSRLASRLSMLSLLVWLSGIRAFAQTPAALDINLYPGLTITGSVGTVYSIEYVTDLSQKNAWRSLEFFQLPATNYLWIDSSALATSRRFYRAVPQTRPDMVFIPPGTFRMGSPTNEVGRQEDTGPHTVVTLTKGFYMGKYKVTQRDYQWVIGTFPSAFPGDFDRPVETISWEEATNYCAQLTKRERAARLI